MMRASYYEARSQRAPTGSYAARGKQPENMNDEIPYNPPGMDEYIRAGARKNSALLRKMRGEPEPSATAEIKRVCISDLLAGVEQLAKPDFHKLNVHAARNDRLLHAVLCAYAKHTLEVPDIGWQQLGEILHSAICNEIGTEEYLAWCSRLNADQVE